MKAKGPAQSTDGQAGLYLWIFCHVLLVIELDEIVPEGGEVEEQSNETKPKTYQAFRAYGLQLFAHAIIQ
ncbi:MAG: hypothetical protein U1F83_11890 [Verrucomicrobiota bacterium]